MYPQWATIEAGSAVAEPVDDRRLKTSSLPGLRDAASSVDSVRHALRAIASDAAETLDRRRWVARVRPLVDRSQAMLRTRFEADGSVTTFLRGRARIADSTVIGLLHLARAVVPSDKVVTVIAPLAVLAVGGYGRRELATASDLDLLFLLGDPAAACDHAERLIGFVLTGLWDLGFEVGHTSRTVAECEELASAKPKVLASLLDARFLARFATSSACCGLPGFSILALRPARRASLRGCMPRCPRSWARPVAFFGRSGATCTCSPAGLRIVWCTNSSRRSRGASASAVARTRASPRLRRATTHTRARRALS